MSKWNIDETLNGAYESNGDVKYDAAIKLINNN